MYTIQNVTVSREAGEAYNTFKKRIDAAKESSEAKRQALISDLNKIVADPQDPVRPVLWFLFRSNDNSLGPELPVDALVLHLTEVPLPENQPNYAVNEMLYLTREEFELLSHKLAGRMDRLDARTRDALRQALKLLGEVKALKDRATAGDQEAAVQHFIRVMEQDLYDRSDRDGKGLTSSPISSVPTLQTLLALNPDECLDLGVQGQKRLWSMRQWFEALRTLLIPFFTNGVPDELWDPVRRQYVEREWNPLRSMRREFELPIIERLKAEQAAGSLTAAALAGLRRTRHQHWNVDALKWVDDVTDPPLNSGEAWSNEVLGRLGALPPAQHQNWLKLMALARKATSGKPNARWLKDAQALVDAVGPDTLRNLLLAALPLLGRPRTLPLRPDTFANGDPSVLLDEFNAMTLKGLLWMTPLIANVDLTRVVARVVDSALKKVAGVGPRAPKVANAAVYALSTMTSDAALAVLARLSSTLTYKGTLNEVRKGLKVVADRLGTSPEDLLELGVPTLGMQDVGHRSEVLADVNVDLRVDAEGAKLTFSRNGKALKAPPPALKKEFAEELKELKATQKEAEGAVAAITQRLDALMISGQSWRGDAWQERYLNHPLTGTVAWRLIWLVDGVPALWHDGEMRTTSDHALNVNADSEIRLWHPIGRPLKEVLSWRERLETLAVRQPFKQAWREVYLLTDAERLTGTYSNRFAAHVLKQHQFNQLAALRGWSNRLRLSVDDSYPPATRDLPEYGLRAEYWVEGIWNGSTADLTDSGAYLHIRTDQLRFYPIGAPLNYAHASGGRYGAAGQPWGMPRPEVRPLEQVPPLVLSEIMRDVDLFVGVASVGNDPTWQDGGPAGAFRDYWQTYSFGELSETAKTRAAYLERLIPRLMIRDRLELSGRFLQVRGDLRTYKIHLGSSNILMEPNDQYLCIVPDARQETDPELDFDGDRILSLILSKAFLLADDTRIKDAVILNQLRRA